MTTDKINKSLFEDTTTPAAPNIETTDENLSINNIFQQNLTPSLGRQIFHVIPMYGPTGGIFNVRRKSGTNNFEVVRRDVSVYPTTAINTGLTKEVIQDMYAQFGLEADNVLGTLLRGLANEQENTKTLEFLEANAKEEPDLAISDYSNAEINLFETTQRVHELILRMNNKNTRTYEAFVVMPYSNLAGIMGLRGYAGGDNKEAKGLFITELNQTRFYLNPDPTSIRGYVGLKDVTNPSKSSAVFSPYQSTIVMTRDYDSGEPTYFIFNRFAITASPLHVTNDEMLYKFNVA